MKNIFLREVVKAVNGKFFGDKNKLDEMICDVKIDSRKVCTGSLFIAIKGEKFDGHDFIDQAFLNGAVCVLSEKNLDIEKNFIKVESCKQALMDLAEYYRNLFDIKVIGITGSYGKTSVKDLTADILMEKYNVVRTMGNFNNNIGLPLSVFELNDETEILVLEMGTNHFGEISNLSKIVRPDVCVINNIGVAHMENFLSRDGILKAKCEIFDYANKNFVSILNGDDEYLRKIKLDEKQVFYCGFEKNNDIYVEKISDDKKNFKVNIMDCEINLDFANEMFIKNCVMAIGIGKYFGVKDKDIKKAIENFEFKNMRMELINVKNKFYIISDVYNANPDAMKGAIDSLVLFDKKNIKKKICILGDMLELGDEAKEFHEEIGKYIDNKKIDLVICIGELAKNIFDEINKVKKEYFRAKEDFFDGMNKFDFDESVILIKASRGMKFEEIVNKFVG